MKRGRKIKRKLNRELLRSAHSKCVPVPVGFSGSTLPVLDRQSVPALAGHSEGPVCLYYTLHESVVQRMTADELRGA